MLYNYHLTFPASVAEVPKLNASTANALSEWMDKVAVIRRQQHAFWRTRAAARRLPLLLSVRRVLTLTRRLARHHGLQHMSAVSLFDKSAVVHSHWMESREDTVYSVDYSHVVNLNGVVTLQSAEVLATRWLHDDVEIAVEDRRPWQSQLASTLPQPTWMQHPPLFLQ